VIETALKLIDYIMTFYASMKVILARLPKLKIELATIMLYEAEALLILCADSLRILEFDDRSDFKR
jgi:hypothetical protein